MADFTRVKDLHQLRLHLGREVFLGQPSGQLDRSAHLVDVVDPAVGEDKCASKARQAFDRPGRGTTRWSVPLTSNVTDLPEPKPSPSPGVAERKRGLSPRARLIDPGSGLATGRAPSAVSAVLRRRDPLRTDCNEPLGGRDSLSMATRAAGCSSGPSAACGSTRTRARRLIAHGALLVDVRRHDDTAAPLDGALRIPPDEIPQNLVRLRRGTTILLTCT